MLFVKLLSLTFATKLRVFSSVKLVWFCFWLYISLTCIYTFREGLGDQMFPKCWQSAFNCLVINDHFGEPCSALWTTLLSGGGELFSRCTLPVSTFLSIEPLAVLCCVGAIMSVHCTLRRTKEAKKKAWCRIFTVRWFSHLHWFTLWWQVGNTSNTSNAFQQKGVIVDCCWQVLLRQQRSWLFLVWFLSVERAIRTCIWFLCRLRWSKKTTECQ